ncbi:MAG TPA: cytochrome c [Pseudolabrys sp.]|jgi:ubiquinol-cytochrome c reductase cytochrome c subunit
MRHQMLRVALAALAAGVVLGHSAALAASAEKGKDAFVKNGCWQCHGFLGQGGITGPKLAPDPLPLESLSAFIRSSNGPMPPYTEKVLSNEDLADIHTYLSSIAKALDYKTIPLLSQ